MFPLVAPLRVLLVRLLVHLHFDCCCYSGAVGGVAKCSQGGHVALLGCCTTRLSLTAEAEQMLLEGAQLPARGLLCATMPGCLATAADTGGRLRSAEKLSGQCLSGGYLALQRQALCLRPVFQAWEQEGAGLLHIGLPTRPRPALRL